MKKYLTFSNLLILSAIVILIVNSVIRYDSNQAYKRLELRVKEQNKIESEFTNSVTDLDTSMRNWEKTIIKMNKDRKDFLQHLKNCDK